MRRLSVGAGLAGVVTWSATASAAPIPAERIAGETWSEVYDVTDQLPWARSGRAVCEDQPAHAAERRITP